MVDLEKLGEFLRLLESDLDLLRRERLDEVIKGPILHAFHGRLDRAEAGGDHHERSLRSELDGFEQVGAFAVGQTDIDEHEVEVVLVEAILGGRQSGDGGDVVAALPKLGLEVLADDEIVFQDDDFLNGHGG